jgi:muramoyltetrapeptide carboxypeptidase LdcA involved in peptidoglycan recycling
MSLFIKPKKLNSGDTIATVSLSGGRAGDPDMLVRYNTGKQRLEQIFGLKVVEMPYSMKGSQYLYKNPEARADDLMEALLNHDIKGIFLNMGGDDGIRLLPYINFDIIKNNPKIFLGFSDADTFHHMFTYAGVTSFYGANVLATISEPHNLNPYTIKWLKKALFSSEPIGKIKPCEKWSPINWEDIKEEQLIWIKNDGYKVHQGKDKIKGHSMVGCSGPLKVMLGTCLFPKTELWKDSIIFLEEGAAYGTKLAGVHSMRTFAAAGIFNQAKALVLPKISEEDINEIILKVLHEEGLNDLPVFSGLAFSHLNPMTVLPVGVEVEIDCDNREFTILESGVTWPLKK